MRRSGILNKRRGAAVAAAAVAATAAIGLAVPALASGRQSAKPPAATLSRILGPGQVGSRAAVPWRQVGPGWSLVLYSATQAGEGVTPKAGPTTLYLVSPSGGRYRIISWAARSAKSNWHLQAWSGDGRRAMFVPESEIIGPRQHVFELHLRTGKVTSFTLPRNVLAVGYTRPDGLNILAARGADTAPMSRGTLMRFSLTGHLTKTVATVRGLGQVAYQPAGAQLAAGWANGIVLVSNAGGVIRKLPVPGVKDGCDAIHWWDARTILATCSGRMWLVPASGARPSALTPVRSTTNFDMGDFNAWQLSSGLYVDGYGACGSLVIGRQPAHGPEQVVNVPGSASSLIVNATRSQLQVERINGCEPGVSLVWFNPATRVMKIAVPVGRNQRGVIGVVPYFIAGKF